MMGYTSCRQSGMQSAKHRRGGDTHAGLVVHPLTSLGDGLAVRLHVSLLEVVRELVQVLVVGEEDVGLRACDDG